MRRSLNSEHRRGGGPEGFTLIEVMIALVILSVGLLAIAGMQGMSLARNRDAGEISVATNLAADIVERIRFNRGNVTAYNNIDTGNAATQPPTSQPQARSDYTQWQTRLNNARMESMQGTVAVVNPFGPAALNQSQVTVQLSWISGRQGGGANLVRTRRLTVTTVITPE